MPDANLAPAEPISVNYFFTRICNLACKFCFHTSLSSTILPLEEAKRGLRMLSEAGMRKVNFAGGEPFTKPRFLGELVKYCKDDLGCESISIISNGSLVTDSWLKQYGSYVDIFGVSCDSFDEETNIAIGRSEGGYRGHIKDARRISEWCHDNGVKFKLNTVVNSLNWEEDMNSGVEVLNPDRWKVFQCLILEGENSGSKTSIRDAREMVVSRDKFDAFVERHTEQPSMVPEPNEVMQNSYLLLDEKMRFLDCSKGGKTPGLSLLDVGVARALGGAGFDEARFLARGGIFEWQKPSLVDEERGTDDSCGDPKLTW